MAAVEPVLDPQWAYVATTLTTSELRALESGPPSSELPQALAYRRLQRERMLQRNSPRFLRLVETKKAVPVETKREDRIHRLQQLYGIGVGTFGHATLHTQLSPDAASRPRTATARAQSQASSAFPTENEEDALLEWTEQLDPTFLSGSGASMLFGSSSLFDSSAAHLGSTMFKVNALPFDGQLGARASSSMHLTLPRTSERRLNLARSDLPMGNASSVESVVPVAVGDVSGGGGDCDDCYEDESHQVSRDEDETVGSG